MVERKSRLYLVKIISDRTSENVTSAIIELLSQFPQDLVKTITCDQRREFSRYKEIEGKLNCEMFFPIHTVLGKKVLTKILMDCLYNIIRKN